MDPKIWYLVIGILITILVMIAGMPPRPGQHDEKAPYSKPSSPSSSPSPTQPSGPPRSDSLPGSEK